MPALKKILCALDLSDQSESVAEYAVMLAKMSGASIVAVYAAPTLTQYTRVSMCRRIPSTTLSVKSFPVPNAR